MTYKKQANWMQILAKNNSTLELEEAKACQEMFHYTAISYCQLIYAKHTTDMEKEYYYLSKNSKASLNKKLAAWSCLNNLLICNLWDNITIEFYTFFYIG